MFKFTDCCIYHTLRAERNDKTNIVCKLSPSYTIRLKYNNPNGQTNGP